MADNEESIFNEQIQIGLDLSQFKADLDSMQEMWDAKMDEMGTGISKEVLGQFNLSSINDQLQGLGNALNGLVSQFSEAMGEVTTSFNSAFESTKTNIEKAASNKAKGPRHKQDGSNPQSTVGTVDELASTINTEQQGIEDAYKERIAKVEAAEKALAENIALEQEGLTTKYEEELAKRTAAQLEADEKIQEAQLALAEEIGLEQEGLTARYQEELEKRLLAQKLADEKTQEGLLALAEEIDLEQEGLLARYEEYLEKKQAADALAAEEKLSREKALAEEIALEQEGLANQYEENLEKEAAAQEKADAERLARQKRLAEEIALEQQGLSDEYAANPERARKTHMPESVPDDEETSSKKGKGFELPGLLNPVKIAGLAAKLVEVYVLWNAINTAVETFTKIVKAPFDIIAEGVKYLSEVEQKGEDLAGVLASSFNFSDNFVKNFQEADEAGQKVIQTLKQIAASSNLKFDNLTNAFKVLSQNGVAQYTRNLSDVVKLTEQFSALIKSSGPDLSRKIATEIPKLFKGDGSDVTGNEVTLKALGINKQQWMDILKLSKEHGDLVERLAPAMAPYVAQLEKSKSTFTDLKEKAILTFEEIAGEASQDIFAKMKEGLLELIKLLFNSKDAFKDVLNIVVNTTLSVISLVTGVDLFASSSKSLPELWKKIGNTIIDVVASVSELGIKISSITGKAKALYDEQVVGLHYGEEGTKHSPEANKKIQEKQEQLFLQQLQDEETLEKQQNIIQKAGLSSKPVLLNHRQQLEEYKYSDEIKKADKDYFGDVDMHSVWGPYGELVAKPDQSDKYLAKLRSDTAQAHADLNKVTDGPSSNEDLEKSLKDLENRVFNGGKDTPPGKETKEHNTDLRDDHKDISEKIAQIKSEGNNALDSIKQKFAELKISQKQAEEESLAVLDGMKMAIQIVTKSYIEEIGKGIKQGRIKPEAGQTAIKQALSVNTQDQTNLDSRKTQVETSYDKEQFEAKVELARSEAAYQRQVAEEKIRLAKEGGASEIEIAKMVTAANKAKYDADIQAATQTLAAFDNIADRTDTRVKKAQQALSHLESEAQGQANIDKQGERDAQVKTDFNAVNNKYLQQNAAYELAKADADRPKPGETVQQHKDATEGVDAAHAGMLQGYKASLQAIKDEASSMDASSAIRQRVAEEYAKIAAEADKAAAALAATKRADSESGDLMQSIFGSDVRSFSEFGRKPAPDKVTQKQVPLGMDDSGQPMEATQTSTEGNQSQFSMTAAVTELNQAFQYFSTTVEKLGSIFDHQGVLAGVGAASQTAGGMISKSADAIKDAGNAIGGAVGSALSSFSSVAPLVGGIMQFAGTAMSIISELFTRKAKEIADAIKQDFTNTMNALSTGQITAAGAIAQVQQQEAQAISQLSGQKGGAAQLKTLLPQLQQEIYQLQQQALQAAQSMNAAFAGLATGGLAPMQNLISLWQQMNQQIQAYITAGGSAAEAQNYVSLSLQNMQNQLNQQLTQEQAQSVNDALQLNQLLQQRIDLQMQYAQQEFQTVNADALERQASYAVTTGTALQQQQYNYNLQMQQLNNQISGYQAMVSAESQIFTIATNTNALQLQGNALQLQQLQTQLAIYKQQQQIVQNIVNTGNGYLLTSALGNQLGNNTGITTAGSNITINVQVGGTTASGYDIATSIQQALQQAGRYGGTTTMQTLNIP